MDRMGNAWSGSIWTYRPYFLECIDFENYRRIYNGNDTFIIESIKKNKKYRYVHSRKFGTQSLDYRITIYIGVNFQRVYGMLIQEMKYR